MKVCTKCSATKPLEEFHKRAASKDGLMPLCKVCANAATSKWAKDNPEKKRVANREGHAANSEKARARASKWQKDNPEKKRAIGRKWIKDNPGKVNANHAKYRAAKIFRTPVWADLKAIEQFYINRPPGYHGDHEIPLQGELVSGLHVLSNLQYLTGPENQSKSNSFNPDDWYWVKGN